MVGKYTHVFHSFSDPACWRSMFESRENTTVSNAYLCPSVRVSDVTNSVRRCGVRFPTALGGCTCVGTHFTLSPSLFNIYIYGQRDVSYADNRSRVRVKCQSWQRTQRANQAQHLCFPVCTWIPPTDCTATCSSPHASWRPLHPSLPTPSLCCQTPQFLMTDFVPPKMCSCVGRGGGLSLIHIWRCRRRR